MDDQPDFEAFRTPESKSVSIFSDQEGSMNWLEKEKRPSSSTSKSSIKKKSATHDRLASISFDDDDKKKDPSKKPLKHQVKEWLNHPKKKWMVIYTVHTIICLTCGLVVLLFCYIINPPMTQIQNGTSGWASEKQNILSASMFGLVAFFVSFALAEAIRWSRL
jgi:hypothetical protein